MFDQLQNYPTESCGQISVERQRTALEQLQDKRAKYVTTVKELDEAIAALEQNPNIEKVLTALGKTLRY